MILWLLACLDAAPLLALPEASVLEFETEIQPILGRTCASGGCHGAAGRPMPIFAPGRHRADPERVWLDEPLTAEELETNLLYALLAADPVDPRLVHRPLAEAAGGSWHGGGVQYEDRSEPDWRRLDAWAWEVWR